MTNTKQAIARKRAWQAALTEGRVVRSNNGMTLTSNKTVHDAKMLVFALRDNGDDTAEIVKWKPTDSYAQGHSN
jgi:hypothetical protein